MPQYGCDLLQLDSCSISTTLPERHCTKAGGEQASNGPCDDRRDLRSNRSVAQRAEGGDQLPMASISQVRDSKSETSNLVLCLRTQSIKGVLIRGTKEKTGSQVSWDGP